MKKCCWLVAVFCCGHTNNIESCAAVQFSCSVVSDSLRPHGLQHARLPSPSPTPGACSNSCPSNQCCHPAISSSFVPFSTCLQSFPASGSFPVSSSYQVAKVFHSNWQSMDSVFPEALACPRNQSWAWKPAATLWLCPIKWKWSRSVVPMDCSLPGSVHRIFQVTILEWAAISFSRGSSQPRDRTRVSRIVGRCFYCVSHQGSLILFKRHERL